MSFTLPDPPLSLSRSDPDLYKWAQEVKGKLEKSHVLSAGIPLTAPHTGDMVYKAPLAWARLSAGSAGQVLTQGTAMAPEWGNISGNVAAGTGITISGSNTVTFNAAIAAGAGISVNGTATRTVVSNIVAGANVTITGTATYTIASANTPLAAGTGIAISGTSTNTVALAPIADSRILSNISGGTAAPSPNSLSANLDYAIGSAVGDMAYRGTSAWQRLAAGAVGSIQFMGTSTAPAWGVLSKIGSFTRDISSSGTQTMTGVGFKPEAVVLLASLPSNAAASIGFGKPSGPFCIFNSHNEAADTWGPNASYAIRLSKGSGTQASAYFGSMDTDGFTLLWDTQGSPTGTATIGYFALGRS